jgi:hypothetical protein
MLVAFLEVGGKSFDGAQWIADFMGNPGRQTSDRGQAPAAFYFPA